jgi:hypothetical protein
LYVFFWENVFSDHFTDFNWIICCLLIELFEFLM